MDLIQEISEHRFTLVLLNEKQYEQKLIDIMKKINKKSSKICYVCLNKPYADVIDYLKGIGLDTKKFFFIDVLSSHYKKPKPVGNCIFIDDPSKLVQLHVAIKKAIMEKSCSHIIFDTISSLLMYEQTHDIVRFTHELTIEEKNQEANKIFIIIKEGDVAAQYNQTLVEDIRMFANKTIDLDIKNRKE